MPGEVRFSWRGMSEARRQLASLHATQRHRIMEAAVTIGAEIVRDEARRNVRRKLYRHSRGTLIRSITIRPLHMPRGAGRAIGPAGLVYGPVHEFGTVIVPRRKRVLSWIDKDTHERVFAKRVKIPKRPYMGPAFRQRRADVVREMAAAITAGIRRVLRVGAE